MSISINEFKEWAGQRPNSAVATTGKALVTESSQLGFFARFFKPGASGKVRGAVMKDFTHALSSRYGVTIARQAISQSGLSSTSQLKGRTIANVISIAKRLRADMLRPAGTQDLRLGNGAITQAQIGGLGQDARKLVEKFVRLRAVAAELLGEMPLTQADCKDFHARSSELISRFCALPQNVPEGIPAADFKCEVDALVKALATRNARMVEFLAGAPLGKASLQEYRDLWRDVAINAMTTLRGAAAGNASAAAAIDRAIDLLRNDAQTQNGFCRGLQISKDAVKKTIAPFIANLIRAQLTQGNVRGFRVKEGDIVRALKTGYRQTLNERPWQTISKTMAVSIGGRPIELTSTIRPAEQLGRSQQAPRGVIAGSYPPGVHGYMCGSADAEHAVNLAVSSLSVSEPGGTTTLAFCGVRHSVHHAWEIRNANDRSAANVRRAEEAVIAAFMAKYDIPENHEALPELGEDGMITVDLNMTSVALLTPDKARHGIRHGSSSDERCMLEGQTAAWDAVQNAGVTFEYKGRQIRVMPKILKFNFGVNEGAVNSPFTWASNFAGGWDRSKAMNKVAFEALTKDVMAFLNDKTKDAKAKAAAFTLYNQCDNIFALKRERVDSHDAYKAAARIAVLSRLIGKVPCWNCKSGKDRTSEMDVECKFLSVLIARGEQIPEPGAKLTEEQKGLFRTIALEGGNFEVQKMNTGIAGFKTGGVNSIAERLGGSKYREFHRGASDHVNV